MRDRNARIGLRFFFAYLVLYAGFVLLNAFAAHWMERTLGGVNVAILYGFGLIAAAIVLAMIYGMVCDSSRASSDKDKVAP